jgi:ubiquitin fusion degradation protein 1
VLKAVPSTKTAGDRVTLPVSALEELDPQGVLDTQNTPLTFELSIEGGATTHAGVAEFVADEGTIGLPPKTALSLTKGSDWDILKQVKIRYVKLGRYPKTSATFQPRGSGFHTAGQDIVNIDIKTVLERTLHDHTTLTKGDWFPLRHEGVTYEIVVRDLQPEDALSVIHTDMEVDVMMSEVAEEEELQKKAAEDRMAKEAMAAVERATRALQRAAEKREAMAPEPAADEMSGVVRLVVRMPDGSKQERRFLHSEKLRALFDFMESLTTTSTSTNTTTAVCTPGSFRFRQQYPRRLLSQDEYVEKTFEEAQLNTKQEALFLEILEGVGAAGDPMDVGERQQPVGGGGGGGGGGGSGGGGSSSGARSVWDAAYARVETNVDDAIMKQTNSPSPRSKLAREAKMEAKEGDMQWGPQLRELRAMGFVDTLRNMELLNRYQGRMLRVVNVLSESMGADGMVVEQGAQGAQGQGALERMRALQQGGGGVLQQGGGGVALMQMDAGGGGDDSGSAAPTPLTPAVGESGGSAMVDVAAGEELADMGEAGGEWGKELADLAAMGFLDTPRNLELLERYQGRILRVANVLSGGD